MTTKRIVVEYLYDEVNQDLGFLGVVKGFKLRSVSRHEDTTMTKDDLSMIIREDGWKKSLARMTKKIFKGQFMVSP